MDSQDFIIIRKTYEVGSISKAAQALYLSPQALSKRIKRIENELGTVLFERTSAGMQPTKDCHRFYEQSDDIYNGLSAFLDSFKADVSLEKANISVASTLGVLALITPEKIQQFKNQHREIQLRFIEYSDTMVEEKIRDKKCDFGLIVGPVDPKYFSAISLCKRQFCVVSRPGFFPEDKKEIPIEKLHHVPLAIENKDFKAYHIILSACHAHGFHPSIFFETTEINFAHSLARSSDCAAISVMDDTVLQGTGDLEKRTFQTPLYWEIFAIIRNGETFSDAGKTVLNFITDSLS